MSLEMLAKKVVMSDQFEELKELMPQLYRLTQNLYKDVEYGSVSPDLQERVEKHFKYLWRYLNLGDNISLTGPEAAFVGDMHRNAKAIRTIQSDKRRASMFGESKKITKKQINKLIESIVAEMCDEELNESELSPDPEWDTIQGAPMHQRYPGSFEEDGQRPDLKEGTNIRWDNGVYKAAISANKTAELIGNLISHSNGLNEDQLFKLKQVHEKASHLAKLVEIMKNWRS